METQLIQKQNNYKLSLRHREKFIYSVFTSKIDIHKCLSLTACSLYLNKTVLNNTLNKKKLDSIFLYLMRGDTHQRR